MHCFRVGVKMACAFATTNKYKERDESWFVDLHSNLTLHCLRQREITLWPWALSIQQNSGLKFGKLHVLNGTVHSGCIDPTQATARFVIVASQHTHNYALKEKSKYCLYPKEHSTVEKGRWKTKGGGILFRVESLWMQVNAKKFLWIEAIRFSEYSNDSKQFLELYGK